MVLHHKRHVGGHGEGDLVLNDDGEFDDQAYYDGNGEQANEKINWLAKVAENDNDHGNEDEANWGLV